MTWDSLFKIAGGVGLPLSEFWSYTPREFFGWVLGANESKLDNYKASAELHRLLTLSIINTQLKKPIGDPKRLMKFAWEAKKPRKLVGEELERFKNW